MSASLEELRPLVDQLLDAMGERMPGNGCVELHFHEGLLVRAHVNRVYRPKHGAKRMPLDNDGRAGAG